MNLFRLPIDGYQTTPQILRHTTLAPSCTCSRMLPIKTKSGCKIMKILERYLHQKLNFCEFTVVVVAS